MSLSGAMPAVEENHLDLDQSISCNNINTLTEKPIVIVGNGPVGTFLLNELFRLNYQGPIKIFGNEAAYPYDRVQLSSLLNGGKKLEDISIPVYQHKLNQLFQYHNCPIASISKQSNEVIDENGNRHPFKALVLAVGSRPHIPQINGTDLNGVFTFRDLQDTEKLIARRVSSRKTVIVGGGLLGIEAAKAMRRLNTDVVVIHQSDRLMNRQLDKPAADMLDEHLKGLGIETIFQDSLREINAKQGGHDSVDSITLRSGKKLACDTVILATGITPNVEIARKAWLKVRKGIVVDNHLQCSESNIYAIGECSEHNGRVYGLVAPGIEQAKILAAKLCGYEAEYKGSLLAPKLKVANIDVFSMGDVGDEYETWGSVDAYQFSQGSETGEKIHRSIFVKKGKVVGAVAVGPWGETARLQESIIHNKRLWPWHYYRFKRTGNLWGDGQQETIENWPSTAVICNCRGVTKGSICSAISSGCTNVNQIAESTGASSVCGSCAPLVEELCQVQRADTGAKTKSGLLGTVLVRNPLTYFSSISILLTVLFWLAPPLPYLTSVMTDFKYDQLWRDSLFKQITGFSLLFLTTIALLISARKRLEKLNLGKFSTWRTFHTFLAIAFVALLISHTGARLGDQLNYYLMINFLCILALGGFTGIVVAIQNKYLLNRSLKKIKSLMAGAHIYVLWPLPVLLGFHIVSVYYF